MYCQHCGKEVNDEAVVCIYCGCAIKPVNSTALGEDVPDVGINVLAGFIPIVGFVLYCVWNSIYPKKANSVGKWALGGFCLWLFLWCLIWVL